MAEKLTLVELETINAALCNYIDKDQRIWYEVWCRGGPTGEYIVCYQDTFEEASEYVSKAIENKDNGYSLLFIKKVTEKIVARVKE